MRLCRKGTSICIRGGWLGVKFPMDRYQFIIVFWGDTLLQNKMCALLQKRVCIFNFLKCILFSLDILTKSY